VVEDDFDLRRLTRFLLTHLALRARHWR
jgi:hypothetical protein